MFMLNPYSKTSVSKFIKPKCEIQSFLDYKNFGTDELDDLFR